MRPGCGSRILLSTSWWKELELVRDGDLFTVALSCAQNFLNVPLKPTQLAVLAADSANHHQLVPEGNNLGVAGARWGSIHNLGR